MDDVKEDLRKMGVTHWRRRAHRRDDWKTVVKEAKVLQGLKSQGVQSSQVFPREFIVVNSSSLIQPSSESVLTF
jgi:hypothetical protein